MFSRKIPAAAFLAGSLLSPAIAADDPIDFDFYGSLRIQYEGASPDGASSYTGFRDAYSRIGFNASAALADGVTVFGQLELPLDLVNGAVQDPYDNDEDLRIARIGLDTRFGTFAYGQDWMPYYNAIAYPVDMFSSYYSGFATYTAFRVSDSVFYYSPDLNGFSFGASYSNKGGYDKADGSADDRYQLTASYRIGDTTLSAGIDDVGGAQDWRFYGISLMHTVGGLYIGAKLEWIDSDQATAGFGRDGDTAMNLYAGYTMGRNTLKGMIADVEGYGGTVFHIGLDHDFNDRLTLFAEYYSEDEGAAIPTLKARDAKPLDAFGEGGDVFAVGARYSF
jgi:predicted porin